MTPFSVTRVMAVVFRIASLRVFVSRGRTTGGPHDTRSNFSRGPSLAPRPGWSLRARMFGACTRRAPSRRAAPSQAAMAAARVSLG